MIQRLNLNKEEVENFLSGKEGRIRSIVTSYFMNIANESASFDEAQVKLCAEDSRVVSSVIDDFRYRLEILDSMLEPAQEGPNWIVELFTEDKTKWVSEYSKRINEAYTISQIMKVIEQIDSKIDEIKDVLEDNVTFRKFLRMAIKAGVITIAAGVSGVAGAAAIVAALANSSYINRGKSLLRQVQNELLTLRRKAISKRDALRKTEYKNHRDEGMDDDGGDDSEDDEFGSESVIISRLLNGGSK
jgi:hypothetical protein